MYNGWHSIHRGSTYSRPLHHPLTFLVALFTLATSNSVLTAGAFTLENATSKRLSYHILLLSIHHRLCPLTHRFLQFLGIPPDQSTSLSEVVQLHSSVGLLQQVDQTEVHT